MSDTDPLARERFRTILTDNLTRADKGVIRDGILDDFPDAHFEHRMNEHGVRVRRVVVAGEWEVDPMLAVKNMQEPCDTCAGMGCAECEPPSLGKAVAALRANSDDSLSPGPILNPSGRHPYVDTRDHGRSIGLCSHLTMISGHEGTLCYAAKDDPIHEVAGA